MGKDRQKEPDNDGGVTVSEPPMPTLDTPDLMTVGDYARESKIGPIMLAGFYSTIKTAQGNPWRTRADWDLALAAFMSAPA